MSPKEDADLTGVITTTPPPNPKSTAKNADVLPSSGPTAQTPSTSKTTSSIPSKSLSTKEPAEKRPSDVSTLSELTTSITQPTQDPIPLETTPAAIANSNGQVAKVAIGMGIALGILVVIVGILLWILLRKRRTSQDSAAEISESFDEGENGGDVRSIVLDYRETESKVEIFLEEEVVLDPPIVEEGVHVEELEAVEILEAPDTEVRTTLEMDVGPRPRASELGG